jgi:hypothetical protein
MNENQKVVLNYLIKRGFIPRLMQYGKSKTLHIVITSRKRL